MTDLPYTTDPALPDPLPDEPFGLLCAWFDEARNRRVQPNPDAMALATVGADGAPSVRVVLCKAIEPTIGRLTFYTNYRSRKSREIDANPRVAAVMHWDALDRQVRVEGLAHRAGDAESDAYFRTRRLESRLGAWASDQSEPIESREALLARVMDVMARFGVTLDDLDRGDAEIPRPPHWGGWHIVASAVELWVGGPGRIHDRARWRRPITDPSQPGGWSSSRLQP
ncbi:MAG: pyridoxamine 5'-phosphate oxidase [Planctomycetota bacterium]|nr:MAG: pyridoxamine 5'-phosphate oxidase [Planctomycetota bacterium]